MTQHALFAVATDGTVEVDWFKAVGINLNGPKALEARRAPGAAKCDAKLAERDARYGRVASDPKRAERDAWAGRVQGDPKRAAADKAAGERFYGRK